MMAPSGVTATEAGSLKLNWGYPVLCRATAELTAVGPSPTLHYRHRSDRPKTARRFTRRDGGNW
jgi:hypothetical protein